MLARRWPSVSWQSRWATRGAFQGLCKWREGRRATQAFKQPTELWFKLGTDMEPGSSGETLPPRTAPQGLKGEETVPPAMALPPGLQVSGR